MPAEMLTRKGAPASPPIQTATQSDDDLRKWARKHVERVRKLKRDAAAYVLGMVALTAVWAVIEWQDNGGFARFSDGGNSGDWNPWILYVALIWGFLLGIDAIRTYFDRPTTEADIDRAIERLRSRS